MNHALSENARVVMLEGVSAREFDGAWIVLDLHGGKYFALDEIGAKAFELLHGGHTLAETAKQLATIYDATQATIVLDMARLVSDLISHGLVRISDAAGP